MSDSIEEWRREQCADYVREDASGVLFRGDTLDERAELGWVFS